MFDDAIEMVTPYEVKSASARGVDYEKLRGKPLSLSSSLPITDLPSPYLVKFGCSTLTDERGKALVERVERLTGKPAHPLLRRGIFFAHRDLEAILDRHEKGLPFYLYTGRGPSSGSLHLGHLVPFMFTKYLQEVFNVPLVIQVTVFIDLACDY